MTDATTRIDEIVEAGYRHASEALAGWAEKPTA